MDQTKIEKQQRREAKELARRERQVKFKENKFYIIYLFMILSLVFITDEIASTISIQFQSNIVNEFFVDKKGMTLVEVLAVIAIMGILAVLVVPSIINMRNETLNEDYNNRVEMIKNAAIEWGNDNLNLIPKDVQNEYKDQRTLDSECAHPTVGYLIESGYLKGASTSSDEGYVMINPKTGEEMNNLLVCIRYDNNDLLNRKLVSYIIEE